MPCLVNHRGPPCPVGRSGAGRPRRTIPWSTPMNPQSLLVVLNIVLLLFAIRGVLSNPRLSKVAKVSWVAFIVIAPFIGSLAYLAVGRRGGSGGSGTVVRGTERPSGWFFER
ncbi:hypothetical protein C5C42_07925 [Rathayibacter sp. AY1F7]|nr:hypothetical protein C5C54_09180 [Rathayibacter sp. AY1F2]PPG40397.1 hypothetical protein C5C30_09720 [Rathayibacter sp. AY2B5]PPH09462.1 hypothetical protein C5C33_02535 [Rathayibacter sp. AY1H3]PPH45956.1 hypothetical protein C5C42_07925 [Rathayibacter sp. AY1F7]PPH47045.1 hypothetical protein C5D09_06610 [Rathayibacter sp. AY1C9]